MWKKEWVILLVLVILFIFFRSIHFTSFLNFSADQGMTSLSALEIFREKKLTLIGPPVISIDVEGRNIFYGSIFYYFQLIFLILGSFDPVFASYIFMIFASISLIPLYYSTKILLNKNSALLISILFSLLPFYIDYTRFLWNPNYQLVLLPYSLLLLALFKQTKKTKWTILNGIFTGILIPLHYLLVIPAVLEIIFYKYYKASLKQIMLFILGGVIGFLPLILFEIRNSFYNINTIFFYLQNLSKISSQKTGSIFLTPHYYLTYSLFILLLAISFIKEKINNKILIFIFLILIIISSLNYFPKPTKAFRMPENWNYQDELKTSILIKNNLPKDSFNVTNLTYNTKAWVSKYLLYKNNIKTTGDDYYNNKYLFVINEDEKYMLNYAYEVNKFTPSKQIGSWNINQKNNLYLLEKTTSKPLQP